MKLWFVLEYYDLVKFGVLDKFSGLSMVPKGTINLGSGVVRFCVFIKNPSVVSMLGWILVLGLYLSFSNPNSQVVENTLVTCGTRCFDSCIFEAKSIGCEKIHWSLLEPDVLTFVYSKSNPQIVEESTNHMWNSLVHILFSGAKSTGCEKIH